MATRLAPTPILPAGQKTITVGSLLRKVKALVLEEPKRMNLYTWVYSFKKLENSGPACGTVGCIAGWAGILLRGKNEGQLAAFRGRDQLKDKMPTFQAWQNLVTCNQSPLDASEYEIRHQDVGTEGYAKAVAARIDAFLAKYPDTARKVIRITRGAK